MNRMEQLRREEKERLEKMNKVEYGKNEGEDEKKKNKSVLERVENKIHKINMRRQGYKNLQMKQRNHKNLGFFFK